MSRYDTRRRPRLPRGVRATALAAVIGLAILATAAVAQAAPPPAPAPPAPTPTPVSGTPCTSTAKACVDLAGRLTWLIADGKVTRGPVRMMPGPPDQPTPVGTFSVQWKDPHHISSMPNHAPMPNSVFFADGGVAFHEGSLTQPSAGCVHLSPEDSKIWYDTLQVGDEVQVH